MAERYDYYIDEYGTRYQSAVGPAPSFRNRFQNIDRTLLDMRDSPFYLLGFFNLYARLHGSQEEITVTSVKRFKKQYPDAMKRRLEISYKPMGSRYNRTIDLTIEGHESGRLSALFTYTTGHKGLAAEQHVYESELDITRRSRDREILRDLFEEQIRELIKAEYPVSWFRPRAFGPD